MKKVPRVRREMATYTPDEIRRVLRAADKDRSGHLWYLALSGLRRGEIARLRWSDFTRVAHEKLPPIDWKISELPWRELLWRKRNTSDVRHIGSQPLP